MITIEEIINTKNLKKLFMNVVKGKREVFSNKYEVIRKIRAFAPLSFSDLEEFRGDDILIELEKYSRWSILKDLKENR